MKILFVIVVTVLGGLINPAQTANPVATFTNPLNQSGPDPWMTYYEGNYYLATTTWNSADTGLTMRKASTIAGLKVAPQVRVFQDKTVTRCCNYWAPEFKLLSGPDGTRWYLYYAGGPSMCCANQQIYVAESAGTDPLGPYTFKGQVTDSIGGWMIDQDVMQLNGSLYLLFSAFQGNLQSLFIAPMSNPWTLSGNRALISQPTLSWETVGGNVNEGPVSLQHNGKTFIIYSASSCSTPNYALGQLTLTGTDPLSMSSWTKKPTPVFSSANGVFGPAHNGFFQSPDGTEDWIVYHANSTASQGCDIYRTTRIQKFTWNADGSPNFGDPISTDTELAVPSGESGAPPPASHIIVNKASGKCLDVLNPNILDGAYTDLFTCNGAVSQTWTVFDLDGGYVQVVNGNSGKVLDAVNCRTADGTNVDQFSWLNNNCQQWQMVTTTAPWFRLVNRNSGTVLDVSNCETADKTNVDLWTWLNKDCQQWRFQ